MVSAKIVPRTNDRRDSSVHMTSAQSGKKSYPTALASTAQLGGQLNHYTLAVQPNAMEDRNYSMMVHVKIVHCIRDSDLIRTPVDQIYAETGR